MAFLRPRGMVQEWASDQIQANEMKWKVRQGKRISLLIVVLLSQVVPLPVDIITARLKSQEKLGSPCCWPEYVANPEKRDGPSK